MGVVNLTLIFRQTKHLYDASIQLPRNEKRPAFGWTACASLISAWKAAPMRASLQMTKHCLACTKFKFRFQTLSALSSLFWQGQPQKNNDWKFIPIICYLKWSATLRRTSVPTRILNALCCSAQLWPAQLTKSLQPYFRTAIGKNYWQHQILLNM